MGVPVSSFSWAPTEVASPPSQDLSPEAGESCWVPATLPAHAALRRRSLGLPGLSQGGGSGACENGWWRGAHASLSLQLGPGTGSLGATQQMCRTSYGAAGSTGSGIPQPTRWLHPKCILLPQLYPFIFDLPPQAAYLPFLGLSFTIFKQGESIGTKDLVGYARVWPCPRSA